MMFSRQKVKAFVVAHPHFVQMLLKIYNYFPFMNRIHIRRGNRLENEGLLRHTKIHIRGSNNEVVIGKLCRLIDSDIMIHGNNNKVLIGDCSHLVEGQFYIEDDGGIISIGDNTSICGKTHLACIEGCSIEIGDGCLFSSNVTVRTGDSHTILDVKSEKRINPSLDVKIGNHVWIGNQVIILKGSTIADSSIVGSGSVVTKKFDEKNIVIAGNPALPVKHGIDWCSQRK